MAERQLLFVHGAGVAVDDPTGLPVYLQGTLRDRFDVSTPQMPAPEGGVWEDLLTPALADLRSDAVLVGHSLGGSSLLNTIARYRPGLPAAGLILLSPPFWGAEGWDYRDFALPDAFAQALDGLGAVIHLQARHDEVVDVSHQSLYAARMPAADYRMVDCDHAFAGQGQAALLEAIGAL